MEPITALLSAALTSGLKEVGKAAAKDAYNALKGKLGAVLGGDSEPLKTLEKLEKRPDSQGLQLTLSEELAPSQLVEDPEIKALMTTLSNKLAESENGQAALSQFHIDANKIGVVANTVRNVNLSFK